MCGIFGYVSKAKNKANAKDIINNLYSMSETRGKEASGLITVASKQINYIKDSISVSELIKRNDFKKLLGKVIDSEDNIAIVGHSRLVTNGVAEDNNNNQPVYVEGIVGVHNGIITNESNLWANNSDLNKDFDIDTEVFFKLLNKYMNDDNILNAIKKTFTDLEGVANIAMVFEKYNSMILTTNNGSLFVVKSNNNDSVLFASEKYILEKVIKKSDVQSIFNSQKIEHILPNSLMTIDLNNLNSSLIKFVEIENINLRLEKKQRDVGNLSSLKNKVSINKVNIENIDYSKYHKVYENNKVNIAKLKRCTKCILPETMPFIIFDTDGLCNYCKSYKKHVVKPLSELKELMPKTNNDYDCLVTLSGGRDSCYGLDFVKRELGLNPVTYTYDWGMVTDLARRNQMRMCGSLGVEHILVSADLKKKRSNIRKNVSAWLKNPELGMIPLFMAGDKQYFYWANKVAEQTGVKNIVLCENLLETTKFKTGFCGIAPAHGTVNTYTLSIKNKLQLIWYYGKNFLKTPSYLNRSLLDTVSAFSSYYVMDHNFINLFDYIKWDENTVDRTLRDNYKWETSPDSTTTWRIGDGTAAFYNYIYYTMAGLTENDTFRSNQIREGQITRDEAIRLSTQENAPRFQSIQWYLDTIDLDFDETMNVINNAKKLY